MGRGEAGVNMKTVQIPTPIIDKHLGPFHYHHIVAKQTDGWVSHSHQFIFEVGKYSVCLSFRAWKWGLK